MEGFALAEIVRCWVAGYFFKQILWKPIFFIKPNLSLLMALLFIIMTSYNVIKNDKVGIMTILGVQYAVQMVGRCLEVIWILVRYSVNWILKPMPTSTKLTTEVSRLVAAVNVEFHFLTNNAGWFMSFISTKVIKQHMMYISLLEYMYPKFHEIMS